MQTQDPRWQKFWQNLIWFVVTLVALIILLQFLRSPVVLLALWVVGIIWGGILAYKLSQLLFATDELAASDERSRVYLEQAQDYQAKIEATLKSGSGSSHAQQLTRHVDELLAAIQDLVERMSSLRQNEVIRRDFRKVPKAIEDLENRLTAESDEAIQMQLKRTLTNRRQQLESLEALQNTIKQAEIQLESTISQLGTIYSQLLTGQSTSQVADYSRLSEDVDEEVRLLEDQLQALREVKLGDE